MPVSDQQADAIEGATLDEGAIPQFKPVYNIDKTYKDQVQQWISNAAADSGSAKITEFTIDLSKSSSEKWEESGFTKTSASIGARYWFISARTTVNNEEKEEHLSVQDLDKSMKMTVRATGLKTFTVGPGGWYVLNKHFVFLLY